MIPDPDQYDADDIAFGFHILPSWDDHDYDYLDFDPNNLATLDDVATHEWSE